ncbi:MAG: hypothetical protein EXS39_07385 [Opitutaceae bacterium]|nr:hypothetical protein [Opitutaceae bacterium]
MNTFLKILLFAVLAVVAIKLFPLTLALGIILALMVAVAIFVGFSVITATFCVALAMVAVLAPIWLPALAVVGLIALIKKAGAKSA